MNKFKFNPEIRLSTVISIVAIIVTITIAANSLKNDVKLSRAQVVSFQTSVDSLKESVDNLESTMDKNEYMKEQLIDHEKRLRIQEAK
jgi:phage shock protein A